MTPTEKAEMAEPNLDPARLKDRQAQVSALLNGPGATGGGDSSSAQMRGAAEHQKPARARRSDLGSHRPAKPAPEPPEGKLTLPQRDRLQALLDKWMKLCTEARELEYQALDVANERDRAGDEYRACLDEMTVR